MKKIIFLAITLIFIIYGTAYATNLLTNPGFETPPCTTNSGPKIFNVWEPDPAASVTSQDGITPLEGTKMVQFLYSGYKHASSLSGCGLWQLIDVSSFSALISGGLAIASFSANFNRIAGDSQTDTLFYLDLGAYSGTPDTFPSQVYNSDLDIIHAELLSDDNTDTWESLAVDLAFKYRFFGSAYLCYRKYI